MSQFSTTVILEGRSMPAQTPVRLKAGPLTLLLEPGTGFIRHFKAGKQLLLNGIYAAVRDRNWDTVNPVISELRIDQQPESFALSFTATCRDSGFEFIWRGRITGDAAGTVRYEFEGEANTPLLKNRIGFCVLHSADCAGLPCVVEHVDGQRVEAKFPRFISPHQPFKELRAITFVSRAACPAEVDSREGQIGEDLPDEQSIPTSVARRWEVEVRMDGEVFETEDQRNWTDASFKTYCTPLDLPFPVELKESERVQQVVELRLRQVDASSSVLSHELERMDSAGASPYREPRDFHPLPRIGLGMASHEIPLTESESAVLKRLSLDHLRCDLKLASVGWRSCWEEAVRQATALGCHLHVALHLASGDVAQVKAQLEAVATLPKPQGLVDVWLIFMAGEKTTTSRWTQLASEVLLTGNSDQKVSPSTAAGTELPRVIGGTNAYFAELNRHRPEGGSPDGVTWSINPQVHAFDCLSLLETIETQWQTALSARKFCGGQLMISPLTLKPRFNPNATAEPDPAPPDIVPPEVDVRQMSLFGAVWTLGSIASLGREPLLRSVTFYETTGWQGVMEWSGRPRLPHKFVTRPGWVFPMYFVFAMLAGYREGRSLPSNCLDYFRILVRRPNTPDQIRLLVANCTRDQLRVSMPAGFQAERMVVLDASNVVAFMRDPATLFDGGWREWNGVQLPLEPFAIAAVDGRETV